MFERVSEQIESQNQEEQGKKTDQAPKCASQPSADDQGFKVMLGDTAESVCAHGLSLTRTFSRRGRFLDAQKLKIGEGRGRVSFLHGRAADTARIASLEFASCLN
jgi:hypothetical protein